MAFPSEHHDGAGERGAEVAHGAASRPTGEARTEAAWRVLAQVTDPEIPAVSIVELGMIAEVRAADEHLEVDLTPTFAGCPALDQLRRQILDALAAIGEADARVNIVFDPPWTSDRITADGLAKLEAFGIAPPRPSTRHTQTVRPDRTAGRGILPARCSDVPNASAGADDPADALPDDLGHVRCPHCHSDDTTMESLFGSTLCRSIHYCRACLQSFEHFKEV